jgi:hypothetical protein
MKFKYSRPDDERNLTADTLVRPIKNVLMETAAKSKHM